MQNILDKTYHIFWTIFLVLFVILFAFFDLYIMEQNVKDGYETITDYEVTTCQEQKAPAGVKQVYSYRLHGVEEEYCYLMFYSIHQDVSVYVNDTCVYRMRADEIEISGKSPGCVWNQISFPQWYNGRTVRIEITPRYKSSIDVVPTFYFGSRADITRNVVMRGLPIIILSLVTIVIGIIYIVFILYNY